MKIKKVKAAENLGITSQKPVLKMPNAITSICITSVILVLGTQLIPNCSPVQQKFRAWGENWGFEFYNNKEACQPPDTQNK